MRSPEDEAMPSLAHEEVAALLPWLANGTLDAGERAAVERHVAVCSACRQELEVCRDLGEAVALTDDAAWEPPEGSLEQLMERLPAQGPEASEPERIARRTGLRELWQTRPESRWILAAPSALAAGLATVLLFQATLPDASPRYRTLTDAPAAATGIGPRLELVFADDTPEAELRALLLSAGASIVAGPTPIGVYTVALGEDAAVDAVVARLRGDPRVRLAEPLDDPRP